MWHVQIKLLYFSTLNQTSIVEHNLLILLFFVYMYVSFSGQTWFHGPWFISPASTQHLPTRMFYEKEVFLSSLEETMPAEHITGKCCVLPFREYVRCKEMLYLLKVNFSLKRFRCTKV